MPGTQPDPRWYSAGALTMSLFEFTVDWQKKRLPGAEFRVGHLLVRHFALPGFNDRLSGKKLLFFSDLHWKPSESVSLGVDLRTAARELDPNWIVFGGDLIRHLDVLDEALSFLKSLSSRNGNLAVLGNWERTLSWRPPEFWRRAYNDCGFELLVNEVWQGTEGLLVAGLDESRHGSPDLSLPAGLACDRSVICVSHSPDPLGQSEYPVLADICLAGHTHGGQWRIPRFGAVVTSSKYHKAMEYGWYRRHGEHGAGRELLYVTAGVGMTGPKLLRRRWHCPPEILMLEF